MLSKEMSKQEIEDFLKTRGDFVQIDHLTRFLTKNPPIDIRKFVFQKLGEIYSKKGMFTDAAQMYNNAATACITDSEKAKNYAKSTELYIRAGSFDNADQVMKFAISNYPKNSEKAQFYSEIKEFYKRQASIYEKESRRGNAVRVYEKLLQLNISDVERKEIKEKLLVLYEKLGKINEYMKLKSA